MKKHKYQSGTMLLATMYIEVTAIYKVIILTTMGPIPVFQIHILNPVSIINCPQRP